MDFSNTTLAESSKKLFAKKLEQFQSFMPQTKQTTEFIVDNPEIAVKALEEQTSITQTPANKHMFYSAIVAWLKHTDNGKIRSNRIKQQWETIQKDNWESRRQRDLNNEPTQNQKTVAATLKWSDIIAKRDSLEHGSIQRLLLSMYTYLPPVRADYFEVRIIVQNKASQTSQTNKNYLILGQTAQTSTIVLTDFKTASKYKEIKHTCQEPLYNEIKASLAKYPRNYLFTMPTDNRRPFDRNSFSKWANAQLKTLFQVPMNLTSLRHLYISSIDFNNTRATELEKIGKSMGHSISMQKGYQWIE
jgi:hypothetical protein